MQRAAQQRLGLWVPDYDGKRQLVIEWAALPKDFPLVARYDASGLRRCGHENYLIFYRVESGKVVIAHILHSAQDYTFIHLSAADPCSDKTQPLPDGTP